MATTRTSPDFSHLLAEGRLGPVTLSNRVLLAAMDMNLCHDGEIEQGDIDHYVARAEGGTAMIITGACAVAFPHGTASMHEPGLSEDRFIPGLTALADAVHAAGSKLCIQMTHHGKVGRVDMAHDRPLLVPSAPRSAYDMSALADNTPQELMRMATASQGKQATYKEATEEDIAWLIESFADAARRVRESGADAIEVHCAHGYILGGFLSRADNHRTDQWGGAFENRARLPVAVVRAVREAMGPDMALLVRIAGKEFGEEDGLTTEEAIAASRLFEEAGADAIHVTGWGRNPFQNFLDGPLPNKLGAYRSLAAAVKAEVSVPVVAVGRVLPAIGEDMIAGGQADFVAMGRQLLADPALVNKLRAGNAASVRPCINCYVCVERNFFDETPVCAVNPALGNEASLPFPGVRTPRHVVVVGSGPAGLESARVAKERGHRVTVLESGDRIGGTLWFSQLTTPDNQRLVDWLTHETQRLGVDVRLGHRATADSVLALEPDAVVVATGAVRALPSVPGADLPHVHTGDTLRALMTGDGDAGGQSHLLRVFGKLGKWSRITNDPGRIRAVTQRFMPIGKDVVVIGGSLVGLELAEFLAERGRRVTLVEEGGQVGLPMAMPRRWHAVAKAGSHGVTIHRGATVERITEDTVHFTTEDGATSAAAALVVVASEVSAAAPLADDLRARGVEVHVAGDADDVGYIEGAMHSAWAVARTL
ncbi:NADH oxidase [Nocardioides dokdonensis FR1436]|uniref:NADH oxidase n=1 Tax=Nocardioides dokdonensis FR1436 TaxID=1300347 RepID=A0A1A9GKH2_9ACTN|nr:FAD-dependent oxidoreductase [Nocardioides dokdonensis]ANH38586.1 NADH oxidase [Nocardioides dokdonensis FR1436]